MDERERFGLAMLVVVGVALAIATFAIAGTANDARPIEGCELPSLAESAARPAAISGRSFDARDGDVVAQAEAFVCHENRYARDTRGWALGGADAMVYYLPDASENWSVQLRYTLGTYATPSARYATISITPIDQRFPRPPSALRGDRVSLRGRSAELWRTDGDGTIVRWSQEGLQFHAKLISERGSPTQVNERDLLAFSFDCPVGKQPKLASVSA